MSELARSFANSMMEFINELKTQTLDWEQDNVDKISELREKRAVAKESVQGKANEERAKFKNELQKRQIKHDQEMEGIKTSGERRLRNYKEFLDAVDDMKQDLQRLYPEMPLATSLLLHHHASSLLEKMWHEKEEYEREKLQERFVKFLIAAQDDALSLAESKARVPQNMLRLIEEKRNI
jgi:hypothetical protein